MLTSSIKIIDFIVHCKHSFKGKQCMIKAKKVGHIKVYSYWWKHLLCARHKGRVLSQVEEQGVGIKHNMILRFGNGSRDFACCVNPSDLEVARVLCHGVTNLCTRTQ